MSLTLDKFKLPYTTINILGSSAENFPSQKIGSKALRFYAGDDVNTVA
jgi:hypothetical protein